MADAGAESSPAGRLSASPKPYYPKCLRNDSAEATACLQYAFGEPLGCWMNSEDAIKTYSSRAQKKKPPDPVPGGYFVSKKGGGR